LERAHRATRPSGGPKPGVGGVGVASDRAFARLARGVPGIPRGPSRRPRGARARRVRPPRAAEIDAGPSPAGLRGPDRVAQGLSVTAARPRRERAGLWPGVGLQSWLWPPQHALASATRAVDVEGRAGAPLRPGRGWSRRRAVPRSAEASPVMTMGRDA